MNCVMSIKQCCKCAPFVTVTVIVAVVVVVVVVVVAVDVAVVVAVAVGCMNTSAFFKSTQTASQLTVTS